MAFKTADFKKTTRKSGDERILYPYQIRDDRYTASIAYAIAYYERMVGRRRAEFESETLLEFFGDTRLARGLVACLARTYAWREQTFAEALGEELAQALWRVGIRAPAHLRARLYGLANGRYGGVILPHERAEAVEFLCEKINLTMDDGRPTTDDPEANDRQSSLVHRLTPAQFEQALTLDSEEQHLLIKGGPTPEPDGIVALYNYHSLETALCYAEALRLQFRGPVWNMIRSVHNLARRYRLRYEVSGAPSSLFDERLELTLHGGRDALGSWTRAGRRVVRALLRLLATHPNSLRGGEALVHLKGQTLTLRLDERALDILGVVARHPALGAGDEASEPWEQDVVEVFQKAWSRAFVGGRTAGWRLRRDPEPLVGSGAMVVPDFALQRGRDRLALCLTTGQATTEALTRDLARLGGRSQALAIVPAPAAESLRSCSVPLATYDEQPAEAIGSLVRLLERRHPRRRPEETLTPWQQLERMVAEEGFVEEATVASLMGCSAGEAAKLVQRWGGPALHVLPGLGVCAPESLAEIKQLIEDGEIRQRAA